MRKELTKLSQVGCDDDDEDDSYVVDDNYSDAVVNYDDHDER